MRQRRRCLCEMHSRVLHRTGFDLLRDLYLFVNLEVHPMHSGTEQRKRGCQAGDGCVERRECSGIDPIPIPTSAIHLLFFDCFFYSNFVFVVLFESSNFGFNELLELWVQEAELECFLRRVLDFFAVVVNARPVDDV